MFRRRKLSSYKYYEYHFLLEYLSEHPSLESDKMEEIRECIKGCLDYMNIGNCYTEDGKTVYNLYVSNIPKSMNEKYLQNLFQLFGELKSVRIAQRKGVENIFRYAFINFKKPESAAKALRFPLPELKKRGIQVTAADSWKQPKKSEKSTNHKSINDNDIVNVPTNAILKLNDDCLLHLFSFLSLYEKFKMSNVCERFKAIFISHFRVKKSLNLNALEGFTLMEIRELFITVGYSIENISYLGKYLQKCNALHKENSSSRYHNRFIEFLPIYCPNLKVLQLHSVNNIHLDTIRRITKNLKSLKHLQLVHCDINDEKCLHLSKLSNIETLNISENHLITGKYLHKFQKLRELTMINTNIDPTYFADICKTLKFLTDLKIKDDGKFINNKSFSLLSNNLSNLEILTSTTLNSEEFILNSGKWSKVSKLPNLKSLTIYCCKLNEDLFVHLSQKSEHTLEKLKIDVKHLSYTIMNSINMIKSIKELHLSNRTEFSDDFLLDLAKLKSLQYLNISGCQFITKYTIKRFLRISENIQVINMSSCFEFYDDLILDVIDLLKAKNRNARLELIVGNTISVCATIEKDPIIWKNKLLKISFDDK